MNYIHSKPALAFIGFGYWGPNLVRNFSQLDTCEVKTIVDPREDRRKAAQRQFPHVQTAQDPTSVLHDPAVDAIVIATPVSTHFELARQALANNKHVLIEKPMAATVAEAQALVELAERQNVLLMVDHTFLYTGAVQRIKELITRGEIGGLQYFDSVRINLGLFQPDINVIWDLAPHDISILFYLTEQRPIAVSATGISHTGNGIENIAYLTLHYADDMIAHFSCSWTSPVKVRRILIGGSEKMILYDDIEPTEKVKIYNTGYRVTSVLSEEDRYKILVDYRVGDIYTPKLDQTEALRGVAQDFIAGICQGKTPLSSWQSGLDVVRVLEAAQQSIKNRGREVSLT